MSSLQSVFDNFKNHLKIPGNIVLLKKYEEKKFKIIIYCLEKDILINNELTFLVYLYRKHGLF